ncbi:cytochrome P450 [Phascolomyces articulosus]|uniref:Cytochrome P450 n=1 Tax=Phascolomyces articulosus TaxID=60185 RepID=A0AAD5JMW3_9FUNG|nr:cytochrome P450 [Phascolomyces articulosus]
MSQQLIVTSLYNSKFVGRFLALIRDTPSLSHQGSVIATSVATLAAILFTWQQLKSSRKQHALSGIPVPKDPRTLVGHMLVLGHLPTTFHKWHQELCPIFRFKLGAKDVIVLGSPSVNQDLLGTHGKFTSSRPERFAIHDFGQKNLRGIVNGVPHDKTWSTLRKSVLNVMGPRRLKEESPALCKEADEFVDQVVNGKNIDPLVPLMRVSLNFIFLTLFSIRTESLEDPVYKKCTYIITNFMRLTDPKKAALSQIPGIRLLDPIFGNQKDISSFLQNICQPFFKTLIENGLDAGRSNMAKALNDELNQGKRGNYNNLYHTINDMVIAGTDTTAVTITFGFLQISTMPDIQKKIQQEIDAFVNKNEFAVTHAASEDFEWLGMLIPKDTWFMPNNMEAHMDPVKYPNPEEFKPERFLGQEDTMGSSANRKAQDRDQFNFGWGRRVCVGSHLAETQMFNIWIRVLSRCNIMPALDKNGNEIPESLETVEVISGPIVVSPAPFQIRFVPRNKV